MKTERVKNILVIGASAGGISAVSRLLATFTPELDAAIFVVIHISRTSKPEVILKYIQKTTELQCKIAVDGESMVNRTVYFCPADHHVILEKDRINIVRGAKENHWRPSVDVLFRSAAVAYSTCATGVILTGLLDDGTSGMLAIKRSGGICIVQEPAEAEFSDMPSNVMRNMDVDYVVSLEEIIYILRNLYAEERRIVVPVPADLKLETEIALNMSVKPEDIYRLGTLTTFTCPDCGGTLARISEGNSVRYRCYAGHAFTADVLRQEQIDTIEASLWVAIRRVEERSVLLESISADDPKVAELGTYIEQLKNIMKNIDHTEE